MTSVKLSRRQIDHVQMHVLVTAIVLQSKWYVVRYFQHVIVFPCTYTVVCVHIHFVYTFKLFGTLETL